MDQRQADTLAFMIAVTCFTAPMAAAMLGHIAHYKIRTPAVVDAAVIAVVIVTLVALDFFPQTAASAMTPRRFSMEARTVPGFSGADEIEKHDRLKTARSQEYGHLRARES
jgi:hypothetical protein